MPETGHAALQAASKILNAIYEQLPALKKIKSGEPGIDGGANTRSWR